MHSDLLSAAERTSRAWSASLADGLGTDDLQRTHRILRAWLHTVRDALPITGAVHLGAQLPTLLRGVYYEDWTPERPVERCSAAEFVDGFARAAQLGRDEAEATLPAVTAVMRDRFSPGQLEHALVQLHRPLRTALSGGQVSARGR
jgi:uncharacterized protein (DUF2267 family)